jgi:hypothetical protein
MDVKKLWRILGRGGWRAQGGAPGNHASRVDQAPIGYGYVHSLVDDHSRFAYSKILADQQGRTCARFRSGPPSTTSTTASTTSNA